MWRALTWPGIHSANLRTDAINQRRGATAEHTLSLIAILQLYMQSIYKARDDIDLGLINLYVGFGK